MLGVERKAVKGQITKPAPSAPYPPPPQLKCSTNVQQLFGQTAKDFSEHQMIIKS